MELDRARAKLSDHSNNADGDYEDLRYRAWQARLMVSSFNEFMQIGITGDSSNFIQLLGLLAEIENPVIQESLQYLQYYPCFYIQNPCQKRLSLHQCKTT